MGVCSLATSVAKKPADAVNGLSRHILDRQRAACLRYSTVPLTAPIFFAIFQPTQILIPLVYDAPARRGLHCPSFWLCGRFAAVQKPWLRTPKPLVPIWKNLDMYHFILAFRLWNYFRSGKENTRFHQRAGCRVLFG
jgi:hypothetical protein